ncbi:MAG: hypothetical protein LKI94_09405 [Sporolactobacillus sp.]|nr:hypothetical protein [Sporolactobacillus sp.]
MINRDERGKKVEKRGINRDERGKKVEKRGINRDERGKKVEKRGIHGCIRRINDQLNLKIATFIICADYIGHFGTY